MRGFQKGHKKMGGRRKGSRNVATFVLKDMLERMVPNEELEAMWRKKLRSKNDMVSLKAFELMLHYRFGKPVEVVGTDAEATGLNINVSAIPTRHIPA